MCISGGGVFLFLIVLVCAFCEKYYIKGPVGCKKENVIIFHNHICGKVIAGINRFIYVYL